MSKAKNGPIQVFVLIKFFKIREDSHASFAVNLIPILNFETLLKYLIILMLCLCAFVLFYIVAYFRVYVFAYQ